MDQQTQNQFDEHGVVQMNNLFQSFLNLLDAPCQHSTGIQ